MFCGIEHPLNEAEWRYVAVNLSPVTVPFPAARSFNLGHSSLFHTHDHVTITCIERIQLCI